MVLMTVRNHNAADFLPIFHKICDVRNHNVNSGHTLVGESHSTVQHEYVVLVLNNRHVLSDFIQAPQRDNFQFLIF